MRKVTAHVLIVRALSGLGVTVLACAVLSGCAPDAKQSPSPVPSATATPVFASDEEALAAAEKAYAEYLKVSDEILGAGGADADRIATHVASTELDEQLRGFEEFSKKSIHIVGASRFDTVSIQQFQDKGGIAEVDLYLCSDVSDVRLLDSSGNDVTPASRPNRLPLSVEMVSKSRGVGLVLSKSESWRGTNFC